jgi:hypothetical protein
MHVPLIDVPLMEVPLIGVHSTGVPLIDVLLISWAINLHRCYHWHRCKKGKKNVEDTLIKGTCGTEISASFKPSRASHNGAAPLVRLWWIIVACEALS